MPYKDSCICTDHYSIDDCINVLPSRQIDLLTAQPNTMSIRAKFHCNSVTDYQTNKSINLTAVYGKEGENADFAKYTPSGTLTMTIDKDTKAADYFQPGEQYYLDISNVEKIS